MSTYIRWLKPGAAAATTPGAVQEPEMNTELQAVTYGNFNSVKESQSWFLNSDSFPTENLRSQQKIQVFQSNKTTSSPTALGLLLRSSIFKELVEKNSIINIEERDCGEYMSNQPQIGNDDEYGEILYDGNGGIPFVFSSADHGIGIELQGQFNFSYNLHNNSLLETPL